MYLKKSEKATIKSMHSETSVEWHTTKIAGLKVLQAYVFAITKNDKVLLVRDYDEERFTLPGGKIEENETPEQGIVRELYEEAQVQAEDLTLLGSIEVKQFNAEGMLTDHHQQLRYVCTVENMDTFIPQRNGFETAERIEVAPHELPYYIHWIQKPNGKAQFAAFLAYVHKA